MARRDVRAGAGARKRPGSTGPIPGRVAEIQRQRILGATVQVAGERGAANVTVAHIVARAGISRRTFYELFEDREACLLAALEDAIERATAVVVPAYGAQTCWRERIRAGLGALLAFLDEEPALGRLCVVEALGAGDRALECRRRCMAALIAAVDRGREEPVSAKRPPPLTAEGVVGAVFSIVHARILMRSSTSAGSRGLAASGSGGAPPGDPWGMEDGSPLIGLLGSLMGMIVLPYLGAPAAAKELTKPAPTVERPAGHSARDPLEGLDMRLTYRTVRVLMAIAGHPGASNRIIAEAAGISDQGQISKLLARLDGLGLACNSGRGYPKGAPNAWELTGRGEEFERSIRQPAGPRGATAAAPRSRA